MGKQKSAIKRVITDKKRAVRNNYVKRTIRSLDKKLQTADNAESRQEILNDLYSKLDKAAKKGVIHKRTASRRKARLAAFANKQNLE